MRFPLLLTAIIVLTIALLGGCGDEVQDSLARHHLHSEDLTVGDGLAAEPGDHVSARVSGWIYTDGARGNEVDLYGDDVVDLHLVDGKLMPGLLETMLGMREGGTRRVIIAPEKISRRFRPARLLQDEALWCEVELVSVARISVEDVTVGEGDPVGEGDYVEISYSAWHAADDGSRADQIVSSEEAGEPARLLLGAGMVTEGLDRGLLGMRPGGVRRVVVPPALGYGASGKDDIRPGATIIYEVSLEGVLGVTSETLREGDGPPVQPGQRVSFHLAGWLRNEDGTKGEQFEDSRRLATPYSTIAGTFKIQPGLELGLRGMRAGELRRLDVPADLAFGSRGWHRGPKTLVPPDHDIIYEVEVMTGQGR
jgi:FKBP-type peptidyl-prolyl cis-trans isomerase